MIFQNKNGQDKVLQIQNDPYWILSNSRGQIEATSILVTESIDDKIKNVGDKLSWW